MRRRPGAMALAIEDMDVVPTRAHSLTPADRELQLIADAQRDISRFAPLYNQYVDMVWRFAMSRLRDPERAKDVTSATFVKAIQSLPRFKPKRQGDGTSFPGWLMMIARNTIIDEQRRHRPTADVHDPAIEMYLAYGSTPEAIAIRRDEQERVYRAVTKLSPKQREIVEMRAAGFSGQEIADALGMTINGVRTAHHRAYGRLRQLLADDNERKEDVR
ncbi:MAG: sigma-70 family RNA polymerase sigma factor [Thermomicrobiales bacterium]|nr:sigma-70 family RNA polymerase sigma factor [Thermomicrobiales bacterium]